MNELVKYEAACRAVSEAASIDEAKEFRDQSEAMRAYARQAKNKQMETQAAEIRFRAERRIGELMADQRGAGALSTGGRPSEKTGSKTNPVSAPPSLEEVGIDKKTADRARKYAAIPEEEFNGIVGEWRERVEAENTRVTVDLLAAGKKAQMASSKSEPNVEEASDPYGYSKLTEVGLLDLANGLRADLDDEKEAHRATKAERDALKDRVKVLSGDNQGATISKLYGQVISAKEAGKDKAAALSRETRRANFFEKKFKSLEKENASLRENQEIQL